MNLNRGLGAVLLLIGCFFDSPGQESRPPAEQSRPPAQGKAQHDTAPRVLVSSEEDYRIGPRDVIEIQIEDATELSGTFNVSASGTFLMPYLGRMKAEKKTPEELARIILSSYRAPSEIRVSIKSRAALHC
jgi:protein involved in polysaccharide export with SLBB domain